MKAACPTDADVLAARSGDRAALDRVFASSERLCWWVARKRSRHLPSTMSLSDAVQECRLGVMDAVRKYQPGKSNFATYAIIWMRARLAHGINLEEAGAAPKSTHRSGGFRLHRVVPLERPPDDERLAPIDVLECEAPGAEDRMAESERHKALIRALGRLKPRLRHVVESRLAGRQLRDIGAELGVSHERVRQIQEQAFVSMRRSIRFGRPEAA